NKLKKKYNLEMKIAVIGCVAKELGKVVRHRAPYVDYVFGPQSWHLLLGALENTPTLCDTGNYRLDKFKDLATVKTQAVSAFISIQEGCDNVCTYCIVPFTREREFSRDFDTVMKEVDQVVSNGAREIVFLGQNVNNYKDENGKNLADLIRATAKIELVKRIRYVTSYPTYLTDELIDLFGSEPKVMPFLNLPIQAGSNAVLKKMNRHYTREDYFAIIDKIKKVNPNVVVSSDLIVGFCGETEEDFQDTMDAAKRVPFLVSYSFKYSPRPHTPAQKAFKDDVNPKDKAERLKRLQDLLHRIQKDFNQACIGKTVEVLIDQDKGAGVFRGRSPYMQNVKIDTDKEGLLGEVVSVKIKDASSFLLYGELA
ncbi:MAG: MiaB/RimO family radical SAM methylthiotransferase, partial [Alphaproteobacteria bacterium]|nr:MiaB/RimO family radical SAM methylthiotransferase [Alphaproteobacteria bacterium]